MLRYVRFKEKGFSAVRTLKRLDPEVLCLMLFQLPLLCVSLSTLHTGIWLFSHVPSEMSVKNGFL